jgi:hypothetical protein
MLSFFKRASKLDLDLVDSHVFLVGDVYREKNYDEWEVHTGLKVSIVDISSTRDMLKYREHFSSVVRQCSYVRFLSKYELVPTATKVVVPYSIHPANRSILNKENDETNQNSETVKVSEAVKVDEKVKSIGSSNEKIEFRLLKNPMCAMLLGYSLIVGIIFLSYALSLIV